jgi:hypothetical protein
MGNLNKAKNELLFEQTHDSKWPPIFFLLSGAAFTLLGISLALPSVETSAPLIIRAAIVSQAGFLTCFGISEIVPDNNKYVIVVLRLAGLAFTLPFFILLINTMI